jgi:hypothetical protein
VPSQLQSLALPGTTSSGTSPGRLSGMLGFVPTTANGWLPTYGSIHASTVASRTWWCFSLIM